MRRSFLALVLLLTACGEGSGATGSCGPILREDLDPASAAHVLPNAAAPEYRSDPPTSGPHQPGPEVSGVVDEPLLRPVQVGVLEAGSVLIQHAGLDADEIETLEELAGADVVVAPGQDLPAPVVATAWTYKRTCDAPDPDALQDFIDTHARNAPGTDDP